MGFYPAQAQESEVDLANCFDEFPRWSVGLKQNYQLPRCLCNPPRPSIEQQISLNKNQWCIMELNDPMGSNEKVMKLHLGGMSARLLLNRERGKSRTWLDCVATGRGSSQKFFRFQRLTRASWSNFRTHYCLFFSKRMLQLLMAEIQPTSWYGKYPIIYKVLYMSGGCLGFLPSTVATRSTGFWCEFGASPKWLSANQFPAAPAFPDIAVQW